MKVTQCVKTKPARIKNKEYGNGAKVNDLRFTLTLTLDDGQSKKIHATVSYNKHCLESYKDNDDWNPQLGQHTVHTLSGVSLTRFEEAFDEYGALLCAQLVGADYETFNPELTVPALLTQAGIWFKTDTNKLTKPNFHCFPTVPANHAGGPNTWSLSSENAAAVIRLCRILWSVGDRTYDEAKVAKGKIGFQKEIDKLEKKLADDTTKPESVPQIQGQIQKLKNPLSSAQIALDQTKVNTAAAQKKQQAQQDYTRVKNEPWFAGLLGPHRLASLKLRLKQMNVAVG